MKSSLVKVAFTGALMLSVVVQAHTSVQGQEDSGVYRLTAGDVVEFKFVPPHDNLNDTTMIRPDGRISLVSIGEIAAEGLTPQELSDAVAAAYAAANVLNPRVTTIVREFAAQRVYVGGEVNTPSVVPLRGHVTVLQAVLASGGATRAGRLDSVVLLRYRDRETTEVRRLDLKKVMKRTAADVTLQPYDVIYVPMSRIAKVNKFVEQYVDSMIPRALLFPYNLNETVVVAAER